MSLACYVASLVYVTDGVMSMVPFSSDTEEKLMNGVDDFLKRRGINNVKFEEREFIDFSDMYPLIDQITHDAQ